MFDPLIDLLNAKTPLFEPWGRVAVIAGVFVLAWLVSRSSAFLARHLLDWHDRRQSDSDLEATGKIASIKRRETLVGVIRAGITYTAFALAAVLSIAQLTGGFDRLTALAGASFAVIVAGFAAQRLLVDMLAGLMMFVERWFSVGDTVVIGAAHELQGVVEDVSLRHTRLRALNGEVIRVHNGSISFVRVLPRGVNELAVELFVSDREEGERLVAGVAAILPEGPTTFIRRPWIERVDELDDELTRIRVLATVAPGREWLAEGFFVDLLGQRARDSLIVHGPVTLAVDDHAAWSYSRASAATRTNFRRGGRRERVGAGA
jgi:moderate conductance mechanosensitive channel